MPFPSSPPATGSTLRQQGLDSRRDRQTLLIVWHGFWPARAVLAQETLALCGFPRPDADADASRPRGDFQIATVAPKPLQSTHWDDAIRSPLFALCSGADLRDHCDGCGLYRSLRVTLLLARRRDALYENTKRTGRSSLGRTVQNKKKTGGTFLGIPPVFVKNHVIGI